MRILILIPARGGSRRVENKNLQQVDGHSLLAWALQGREYVDLRGPVPTDTAFMWLVSTDDDAIAAEARRLNALTIRNHPGDGPSQAVVRAALGELTADIVCLVQATSPLRDWSGVERGILAVVSGALAAVTVDPETGKRTGSAYCATVDFWQLKPADTPDEMWKHAVLVPSNDGPDINTEQDLAAARELAKGRNGF